MYRKFGMDISHTAMCTRGKTNRSHFWIYPNAAMNRAHDRVEPLIKDFRDENPDGKLTEDYLKRFDVAVQARVKAFPWVKRWSMGGEDDAAAPAFAGLSASDEEFSKYVTLQIAFYNAVKKANPEAQVVGGQIPCNASPQSGIHSLERFLKAVDGRVKFDLLAIHIYRESPENPDLDSDLDSILKIMDQYGYEGKQLFLPEGGYYNLYSVPQWGLYKSQWNGINNWMYGPLSYDMGWTEKISAAHDARTWLAALKYGDLSNQASKDYVFDVDRFISFEGDTGPYLLYTIVRIKSIQGKYAALPEKFAGEARILPAASESEKALQLSVSRMSDALTAAFEERAPHKICQYVYELSNAFNRFYHETKIMAEEDKERQASYICLLELTRRVLETCIDLLGFEAPDRM